MEKLSASVLLAAAAAARERREADHPDQPPRDCVRQYPTLSDNTTELVGFNAAGHAEIRVELPKDEDIEAWAAGLLRCVRRRDRARVRATMQII